MISQKIFDADSLFEHRCRVVVDKIFERKFVKVRPDWLINPSTGNKLEIDWYHEGLLIGFECDGPAHPTPTDSIKDEICLHAGVLLLRIPHTDDVTATIIDIIHKNKTAIPVYEHIKSRLDADFIDALPHQFKYSSRGLPEIALC